jgi:hypothetical protein
MPSSHVVADVRAALESLSGTGSADAFHDQFLSLDPATVTLVSREQLEQAIPARRAMFAAVGATGTTLRHVEVHELDDLHVLATTTWDVELVDKRAEPLTLESSYLMRRIDAAWRVLVYLNHRDIAAVLAERRG